MLSVFMCSCVELGVSGIVNRPRRQKDPVSDRPGGLGSGFDIEDRGEETRILRYLWKYVTYIYIYIYIKYII